MRSLFLALVLSVLAPTAALAQTNTPGSFVNGFGDLHAQMGDQMGEAVTAEFSNPDNGDVLQATTTGLLYWSPSHLPTWTNGWLHVALGPGDQLVRWQSDDLDPPRPPAFTAASTTTGIAFGSSPRDYAYAAYPQLAGRIDCIVRIESGWNARGWNPIPWGRWGEHASGLGGFLPSTWASTPEAGRSIWDGFAQVDAIAWMLRVGRGREFAGVGWGRC